MTRLVAATLALLAIVTACARDEGPRPAVATPPGATAEPSPMLPPHEFADLAEMFDPILEPEGLRLARGSLQEQQGGRYVASAAGTHLALYVEPTGSYGLRDYVEGLVTVTRVFAPMIFERWAGLRSFDVCQEPRPSVDDTPVPPPVTQVAMPRSTAMGTDWDTFDLATLLALTAQEVDDPASTTGRAASVVATEAVRRHPIYRRAAEQAREAAGAPISP